MSDPIRITVDVQCPDKDYPFVELLAGLKDWTAAVGKMSDPTSPQQSVFVEESSDVPAMIYGEFAAVITTVLSGPNLDRQLPISIPGGTAGGYITDIGKESQSAWAEDGSFLGLIRPDNEAPSGWIADLLPIVGDRVVFPDVGCFGPAGLQDVDRQTLTVLVFDNGTVKEVPGSYPTASVAEIAHEMNNNWPARSRSW